MINDNFGENSDRGKLIFRGGSFNSGLQIIVSTLYKNATQLGHFQQICQIRLVELCFHAASIKLSKKN